MLYHGMPLGNDQDTMALQQVLAGHPSALLELYDRHAPLIFARAYAALRDRAAAEDVVQETFTAAWFDVRNWFSARRDVVEWLLEIARSRLTERQGVASSDFDAAAEAVPLPRTLRDRVLDSIYGAGERLRPPYSTPQWALDIRANWLVWVLAGLLAALIFGLT